MRLLDRYVLREFLQLLLLSLAAFVVIFAIVDLFEKLETFVDGNATMWTVARFYFYKVPWVLVQVLPVALLMSTFLTLGQMSKFNELTAMVTAGLSTVRIITPLVAVALACAGLSFVLNETVVPVATQRRDAILEGEVRRRIVREPTEFSNLARIGRDGRVYVIRLYMVPEQRMHDVLVTELSGDAIRRRIDARAARWDGGKWIFQDGVVRTFDGGVERAEPFTTLAVAELSESPADLSRREDDPATMGFQALRDYVRRLGKSGLRVDKYLVELHLKLAFPFINLIVVVMGAALATRLRHANAALGFGLSVGTAFFYYGLMRAGQALGQGGDLPPVVAAWAANVLFGAIAATLLVQAQRR